jgi:Dehydrogenase E1 component/Protein of unknown function (DUF1524)
MSSWTRSSSAAAGPGGRVLDRCIPIDGNDREAVFAATRAARERAVDGEGPTLICATTMRMHGHGAHDDARYVDPALIEEWERRDPIQRYERVLLERELDVGGLREEVRGEVAAAIEAAVATPTAPVPAASASNGRAHHGSKEARRPPLRWRLAAAVAPLVGARVEVVGVGGDRSPVALVKPNGSRTSTREASAIHSAIHMRSYAEGTPTGWWPSDERFRCHLTENPLYGTITQARVRMLLEAAEAQLHTPKTEKIPMPAKLSIEHIIPQTWADSSPCWEPRL